MIVAGIGCRRGCGGEAIATLVRRALAIATLPADGIVLAAPAFKRDERGIAAAAALLSVPLHWVEEAAMRAVADQCPSRSAAAARAVGHASVAEAAALAAAGRNARLRLARLAGA
ncbi:cobalamin biosynthesis protein, partial [Desertibaculum subflavum]|uniref:cobalamin biosynthesis protein n=1 Tax=Desertibaculum subflavum TaxID=2268458 RepID=UPI0013C4A1A1